MNTTTITRTCPCEGCAAELLPAQILCQAHWRRLSTAEQSRAVGAYRDYLRDLIGYAELARVRGELAALAAGRAAT